MSFDPATFLPEGLDAEIHRLHRRRPLAEIGDPRHLYHRPQSSILRGTIESTMPGS